MNKNLVFKRLIMNTFTALAFIALLTSCEQTSPQKPTPEVAVEKLQSMDFSPIFFRNMEDVGGRQKDTSPYAVSLIQDNIDTLYSALGDFPGPKLECRNYTEWKVVNSFGRNFSGQQVCDHTYKLALDGDTVFVWFFPSKEGAMMINQAYFDRLPGYNTCEIVQDALSSDSTQLSHGISLNESSSLLFIKQFDAPELSEGAPPHKMVLCGDTTDVSRLSEHVYEIRHPKARTEKVLVFVSPQKKRVILADEEFHRLVTMK